MKEGQLGYTWVLDMTRDGSFVDIRRNGVFTELKYGDMCHRMRRDLLKLYRDKEQQTGF